MSRFLNPRYQTFAAYTPGEQPRDQQYIKLNTNESPYPPSDAVIAAVNQKEAADLRLYPDPECKALRCALAELYGVSWENIFVANGSDDILNFAFMAFCSPTVGAVFADITYGFYRVFAALNGVPYREIPLREDFSIDIRAYFGVGGTIFLANPNAPTGLSLSRSEMEEILLQNPDHIVVVDEAYVDFGGESVYPLIDRYENLLVVRTFSKSRCMAGARLGYAFGCRALIEDLEKLRYSTNPYNINRLTMAAGIAAVQSEDYYRAMCQTVMQTRRDFTAALRKLDFTVPESDANFVFARSACMDGASLYRALRERGFLVRHFDGERIRDYNRITIGTPEQMQKLTEAIIKILENEK